VVKDAGVEFMEFTTDGCWFSIYCLRRWNAPGLRNSLLRSAPTEQRLDDLAHGKVSINPLDKAADVLRVLIGPPRRGGFA
jgi:hypothetical protein